MKIVNASYEILDTLNGEEILRKIERIARVCYKSTDKITEGSAEKMIRSLIKNNHDAMLEHYSFSVSFICDRGISHEIVRHRIASFAQESTRYCNYSKDKFDSECTFIIPCWLNIVEGSYTLEDVEEKYDRCLITDSGKGITNEAAEYIRSLIYSEKTYFSLLDRNWRPQQARAVLPNSLKTELVMTGFVSDWKHFFELRCSSSAHPQARELAIPLQEEFIARGYINN